MWLPRIDALIRSSQETPPKLERGKSGVWVGTTGRPPSRRVWRPKVYLCVGARDYWPVVDRLVSLARLVARRRMPFDLKFYVGPRAFDRPDKIVLYGISPRELRALVAFAAKVLPSRGLHALDHAVSAAELGFDVPSPRGLYVGLDPPVGASWRTYRVVCLAWAAAHPDKVARTEGGDRAWFRRMNLSLDHAGPHATFPRASDIPFVRRSWRRMLDALADVELRDFLLAAFRQR